MTKMKDSGIEWIGKIPEDWEVVKNKYIFENKKEIVGESFKQLNRLSLTLNGVFHRSKEDSKGLQPRDFSKYQKVYKNELIFKLIDLENINTSRVGLSSEDGMVSPAYIILSIKDCEHVENYYYYYFLSMWHRDIFNLLGDSGVRSNLNKNDLLNLYTLKIPPKQQEKIANFLDEKVGEIDRVIEKTKEVIKDYKSYKQSLITETVTKGLRKDVALKDSGIEWIGEIPEHWEVTRLKRTLSIPITDGPHETPLLVDDGIPFVSAEAIKNNKINFNHKRGLISLVDHKKYIRKSNPMKNDILMVKSGATTGKLAKVITQREFSIWSPLALIRAGSKLYYNYLFYYLISDKYQKQIILFWNYGTQQNIGMGVIGNLYISFPPLDEQEEIADYLDEKCGHIDRIIETKEGLIKELEAYKKSLIYETVTGKREVD